MPPKTAKKGAAPGLSRHFSEEQLAPLKAKSARARALEAQRARARRDKRDEPLHVRSFAGKIFDPNDEEHTAMVRVAIAAGRDEDKTTSSELVTYVFGATGFRRTTKGGSRCHWHLTQYVGSQCAEEDRSTKEEAWWHCIKNLATAKDQLVFKETNRAGVVKAVWSCKKKDVNYPADSGLTAKRRPIGFSAEVFGEPGATLLAIQESQSALALLKKFKQQVKKLRSSAQKSKLGAPSPRDVASRFADDVCSTTLPHAGRRRCGTPSLNARRRAVPSRASRAARKRPSTRASIAWRAAA